VIRFGCSSIFSRFSISSVAGDEKKLLRLQKQIASYELPIVDELGFVPLSDTGVEQEFPVCSECQTCGVAQTHRRWMHSLRTWRASASGGLLHGIGIGAGSGTETADELTRVNNHRPSIFLASPSRSTWLLAVQFGCPVAGFNDTSK
jgi:hypothetical protein